MAHGVNNSPNHKRIGRLTLIFAAYLIILGARLVARSSGSTQQCVQADAPKKYVCADGHSTVTFTFTAQPCATAPYLGPECTTQSSTVDYPTTQATYGPYSSPTTQTYYSPSQNELTTYTPTTQGANCTTQISPLPTTKVVVEASGTWIKDVDATPTSDQDPTVNGPFPLPGYPNPLHGSNPWMTASGNVHQDGTDAKVNLQCGWTGPADAGVYNMSGSASGGETIKYTWPCGSTPPSTTFTLSGSVTLTDHSAGDGANGNAIVASQISEQQSCSYSVGGPSGFLNQQACSVTEFVDQAQKTKDAITITLPAPGMTIALPDVKWPAPSSDQNYSYPFNGVNWNVPVNSSSPISVTLTVKASASIDVQGGAEGPQTSNAEASASSFSFDRN